MPGEVERDGAEIRLSLSGVLGLDDVVGGVEGIGAADPDGDSRYMVADLLELESLDLEVEDYHRLVSVIRVHFGRGPDYRVAVVGSADLLASLIDDYLEVRDLVAAPRRSPPPQLQIFETVEAAREWAAGGAVRPSPADD